MEKLKCYTERSYRRGQLVKKEDNNVIVKQRNSPGKTTLADRSLYGKFHDYKHVDLRDIMSVFDDYLNIEQSI